MKLSPLLITASLGVAGLAGFITGTVTADQAQTPPPVSAASASPEPTPTPTQSPRPTSPEPDPAPATVPPPHAGFSPSSNTPAPSQTTEPTRQRKDSQSDKDRQSSGEKVATSVVYNVDTNDPVFFITIDDGYVRDPKLVNYVQATKTPITTFLTDNAGVGHYDFFRQVSQFASVENHTVSHPVLTTVPAQAEICAAQQALNSFNPVLLRPPYGEYNSAVIKAANKCGISHVVLWNVTYDNSDIAYASASTLMPGDIVLMHFNDTTASDVRKLVTLASENGLRPANLRDYLK